MADEEELRAFRDTWMTEMALQKSNESSAMTPPLDPVLKPNTEAIQQNLSRALENVALENAGSVISDSESIPAPQTAVESYISATRFERYAVALDDIAEWGI